MPVAFAGSLWSRRLALPVTIAALAAVLAAGALEWTHRLPSRPLEGRLLWAVLAASLSGTAVLAALTLRVLRTAVAEARRHALELEVFATLRGREAQRLGELERRLEQTYRMQTIARLAGGLVHDFNNALSVIQGGAAILLQDLPAGSPQRDAARMVEDAAIRAAGMVRQVLALGRMRAPDPQPVDLREVIESLRPFLARLAGNKIALSIEAVPDSCVVRADRRQLEQLILNLVANARDAMPDGGELTIATAKVMAAKLECELVVLSVLDTGVGMDEETKRHIFDAFFTTKGTEGTGLGLAIVHGIVSECGGRIHVESQPGLGARFDVLLPADCDAPAVSTHN
jgi:signal transduction histidine kinase